MESLKGLDSQVLIEMLAEQTARLTAKIIEKNSVEIPQYEYEISLIQAELNSRKMTNTNTNLSSTDIKFTHDNT